MFVYYINVPLNKTGIKEFENYDEIMSNVKTYELTKEEYEYLRQPKGVFQSFDERFGTIIDVCEEERIEYENLEEALKITNKVFQKQNDKLAERALKKVIDSIERAIKSETFWEIDIYLE